MPKRVTHTTPQPVILPNEMEIGHATNAMDAERHLNYFAEQRYRWLYNDGRAQGAVSAAAFDKLMESLDRTTNDYRGFVLAMVRTDSGLELDAWVFA